MRKALESELFDAIHWIDKNLRELKKQNYEERTLIALGCYDLAIEHQAATLVLYQSELFGTMFAIQRSLFEAVLRGLWFQYCATVDQINFYKNGSGTPNFEVMIAAIEKELPGELLPLQSYRKKVEGHLHHFVHSGYQHVARRHAPGILGPNYSAEDIEQILKHATLLGFQAAARIAVIGGQEEKADHVHKKMVAYSQRMLDMKK